MTPPIRGQTAPLPAIREWLTTGKPFDASSFHARRALATALAAANRRTVPRTGFRRPQDDIETRFGWDRVAYCDLSRFVHAGNLEFRAVAVGLDVDCDHVFLIIGDDGAAVGVGRGRHRRGKFLLEKPRTLSMESLLSNLALTV